jgi:hypothetical protein
MVPEFTSKKPLPTLLSQLLSVILRISCQPTHHPLKWGPLTNAKGVRNVPLAVDNLNIPRIVIERLQYILPLFAYPIILFRKVKVQFLSMRSQQLNV